MNSQLRSRRDQAAARHDAALRSHPARDGERFRGLMQGVVDDLLAVARAGEEAAPDDVELAKTYRWLGDAYFDLGQGKAHESLTWGVKAYSRAEQLLAQADSPVERAKLNVNYANTLRGLSEGFDLGLLEAAETRYEAALAGFSSHGLTDFVRRVEELLPTLRAQLSLARARSGLERDGKRLEELGQRARSSDALGRDSIQAELEKINKTPLSLFDTTDVAIAAASRMAESAKSTASPGGQTGLPRLASGLKASVVGATSDREGRRTDDASDAPAIEALRARLAADVAGGAVPPARAEVLSQLLERLESTIPGGEDVRSLQDGSSLLRELIGEAAGYALEPSWTQGPPTTSRGARLVEVLKALERVQMVEVARPMQPTEVARKNTELFQALVFCEKRVRESPAEGRGNRDTEAEVWRVAADVLEHARREHLTLARPLFRMATRRADSRSVFLSGGDHLQKVAGSVSERLGIELLAHGGPGDFGQERWSQLLSATVAAFDLALPDGARRAEVAYELGLALALGKPMAVITRAGQPLPFNVRLRPVVFHGEATLDEAVFESALDQALSSVVWGGPGSHLGESRAQARVWLEARYGGRLRDGALGVAYRLVEQAADDPVALRRALGTLSGMLGEDAPAILFPAWAPEYPEPAAPPRCFHVMPFGAPWSSDTREMTRAICESVGWRYTRGDEGDRQVILESIWSEISRASAVLVDLTGFNPNVAIELGFAHALGRHCWVMAQPAHGGGPGFRNIANVQVHPYDPGSGHTGLANIVRAMLVQAPKGRGPRPGEEARP